MAASTQEGRREPAFILATEYMACRMPPTLYGGTVVSGNYTAGSLGVGKGLGSIGSLSLDATWAQSKL